MMPFKDKEAQLAYQRKWYKEKGAAKTKAAVKSRYLKVRGEFQEWKKTLKCVRCGEDDSICLEFHHVDPRTKDGDPGNLIRRKGWSLERIQKEINDTCLCLCANCHRKVHREIKQLNQSLSRKT